ncbi:PH domain-containing protein [Melghirimyces algeriensis]|uniref:PH domain-containing protein n=1 Tax=Melghirimyces algeriensis TaxID=910412 RepID=A0A521F1H5_9BACL|nr:PH domain-containing protein [Melghirimyces algeriensis]SMO90052.1 PH domain-containing protein [Melghirimyces algeriensis]
MGIFDGLMGNASEISADQAQQEFGHLLASSERIEKSYVLIRDLFLFTNKRLILVDKQGLTGKKVSYLSIPYHSITRFSIETAGHFDLDAELNIWVSGQEMPIVQKQFNKKLNIYDLQSVLAEYVLR